LVKYTGDLLIAKLGTVDLSAQARTLEISQQANEIDVTTYASTDKEFIAGLVDRTATMEILDDSVSSTVRQATKVGQSGSFTWFPLGTASGKPMLSVGTATVLQQNISYPYADAVLMNVNLRLNGAVTEGTAP
jgi:hypothetical protein